MKDFLDLLVEKYFPSGANEQKRSDILDFVLGKIYADYNDYYMNRELVIKNRVNALNINLPNAKAGEEYSQLVKIEDADVLEYWIEGLEDTGLYIESEIVLTTNDESEIIAKQEVVAEPIVEELVEIIESAEPVDSISSEEEQTSITEVKETVIGFTDRGLVIKGTPSLAGDFDITIKYKYKGVWYMEFIMSVLKIPIIHIVL